MIDTDGVLIVVGGEPVILDSEGYFANASGRRLSDDELDLIPEDYIRVPQVNGNTKKAWTMIETFTSMVPVPRPAPVNGPGVPLQP